MIILDFINSLNLTEIHAGKLSFQSLLSAYVAELEFQTRLVSSPNQKATLP